MSEPQDTTEVTQDAQTQEKKTTYINIPAAFVKEGLERRDNGEKFNLVTLPKNTIINGQDVGGYHFSPLFVNKPAKFENNQMILGDDGQPVLREDSKMRVIPCVANKELWLMKKDCETVKVVPEALKDALAEGRRQYREQQKDKGVELTAEEVRAEQTQEVAPEQKATEPAVDTPAQDKPKRTKDDILPPNESIAAAEARSKAFNDSLGSQTQEQTQTMGSH